MYRDSNSYDFTLNLFYGLLDQETRPESIEYLCELAQTWFQSGESTTERQLLKCHLPTFLRLSYEAPFVEIRTAFRDLLSDLKKKGCDVPKRIYTGPSKHIPMEIVFDESDVEKHTLFVDMFEHDTRCSHLMYLFNRFPEYASAALKSLHYILRCDGPLPVVWRSYIAIIAASRHNCLYLVDLQERSFLANGGDAEWLKGIQYAPKKIQELQELNCILAHRPWLLKADTIKNLVRGSWSMGELAQIGVIMTTMHSLAGIVHGVGICPEIDFKDGHTFEKSEDVGLLTQESELAQEVLYQRSPTITRSTPAPPSITSPSSNSPPNSTIALQSPSATPPLSPSTSSTAIASAALVTAVSALASASTSSAGTPKPWTTTVGKVLITMELNNESSYTDLTFAENVVNFEALESVEDGIEKRKILERISDCARFTNIQESEDVPFTHEDFDVKSDLYPVFRAQDYSWNDHAFSLLTRFYSSASELIDDEFNILYNMTDNQLGAIKVDTTQFRCALWFYVHRLHGILHDDYDYAKVNVLLERPLKQFIKKVVCAPSLLTQEDFSSFGQGLRPEEKIHINLLVMEARKQAQLIYFMQSINAYMK